MVTPHTSEYSFVLKPSDHGVGVFATHDIPQGAPLRLFGDADYNDRSCVRQKENVPELFREFCMDRGDVLVCPVDFGAMQIGWYLNHSRTPNATHAHFDWYAARDIAAGEEILIDYNTLEEPTAARDDYY